MTGDEAVKVTAPGPGRRLAGPGSKQTPGRPGWPVALALDPDLGQATSIASISAKFAPLPYEMVLVPALRVTLRSVTCQLSQPVLG